MDVLSIDFDIIMAPVIEYYNNMVPQRDWNSIQEENPGLITPKADLKHFNYLICLLNKVIKKDTNLYIAFNHKKILDFLKEDKDLNIINIDHHHDLGYHPEGEMENPSCANWVRVLFENNQIKTYIWAKNVNSQLPNEVLEQKINGYDIIIKDLNNLRNKIDCIEFDKIFICLSPEWVPPYYQQLFFGLLDMLNDKFNYHLEIHEGG